SRGSCVTGTCSVTSDIIRNRAFGRVSNRTMVSPKDDIVPLKAGDRAPRFSARSYRLGLLDLEVLLRPRNLVLAFYTADFLPGAALELKHFSDRLADFEKVDTEILCVSCNPLADHMKFALQAGLNVTMISDVDGRIATAYGALRTGHRNPDRILFVI